MSFYIVLAIALLLALAIKLYYVIPRLLTAPPACSLVYREGREKKAGTYTVRDGRLVYEKEVDERYKGKTDPKLYRLDPATMVSTRIPEADYPSLRFFSGSLKWDDKRQEPNFREYYFSPFSHDGYVLARRFTGPSIFWNLVFRYFFGQQTVKKGRASYPLPRNLPGAYYDHSILFLGWLMPEDATAPRATPSHITKKK